MLIVNAPNRNVLASMRSLGKSGYPFEIHMLNQSAKNVAQNVLKTKYLARMSHVVDPSEDFEEFKKTVLQYCRQHNIQVVLGYGFKSVVAMSRFKQEFEELGVVAPLPDFEAVMKAHDKEECFKLCKKKKIPAPKTYFHKNLGDLLRKKITYPVIIKARRNSGIEDGLRVAHNRKELVKHYKKMHALGRSNFIQDFTRPVVQEFIKGKIYDACFFIDKGNVHDFVFQRRIVSQNGSIGPGMFNETLDGDLKDEAFDLGKKILKKIGWDGSCQVELIYDEKRKHFKLIEVNPKLWGTLELSIRSGVDFPLDMIRHYYFKEQVKMHPYRKIKFIWVYDSLLSRLGFASELGLLRIFSLAWKYENEVHIEDPLPELYIILGMIKIFFHNLLTKL